MLSIANQSSTSLVFRGCSAFTYSSWSRQALLLPYSTHHLSVQGLQKNSEITVEGAYAVTVAERTEKEAKIAALEMRLKQSNEEISRLRIERRRLMEISNELRAEVSQLKRVMRSGAPNVDVQTVQKLESTWPQETAVDVQPRRVRPETMRFDSQQTLAESVVDPWLLMPLRQPATESSLGIADMGTGDSSKDLQLTAQLMPLDTKKSGTTARRNMSRSILSSSLSKKGRTSDSTSGKTNSAPVRKVMNYAKGPDGDSAIEGKF